MKKILLSAILSLGMIAWNITNACITVYPKPSEYCSSDCQKYETTKIQLENFKTSFEKKFSKDMEKYQTKQKSLLDSLLKIEEKLQSQWKLNWIIKYKIDYLKVFLKHNPAANC